MNMKVEKHIPNGQMYVPTGHSEPAPTSAPWRMDNKWSKNQLCFSSSANHGVSSVAFFYYLPTNNPQAGC
jgi:hypothetical protein